MAGGSSRDPSQLINHTTQSIVGDDGCPLSRLNPIELFKYEKTPIQWTLVGNVAVLCDGSRLQK